METFFWLIMTKNGSIRTVKNRPGLNWDELAIQVNLEIPDELFRRPTASASIKIKDGDVPKLDIEADTVKDIQEILKREGIDINLTVVPPEEVE